MNRRWIIARQLGISMFVSFTCAANLYAQEPEPAVDTAVQPASPAENQPPQTAKELMKAAYDATKTAKSFDDYDKIITMCEQGLKLGPNDVGRQYLKQLSAWAFNRRGKERSIQASQQEDIAQADELEALALADYEESVRRNPDKWHAYHNRGVSYAMLGEYTKALADFDRTLKLNPRHVNVWFNRGEVHYELGNFSSALRDYAQTIRLKPNDVGAYSARAHTYYQLRRYQSALSDYSQAVQLAPDNVEVLTDRADVYANLGYWRQSAEDYRQAVKLDNTYGRAFMGAAWVMATCPQEEYRDPQLAIDSAEKAIELDGDADWRYLDTLAAAYANAGKYEQAQQAVNKAISKAPQEQKAALEARQELFAGNKPFRDAARTASNESGANR